MKEVPEISTLSRRSFLVGTTGMGILAASAGLSGEASKDTVLAKFDPCQFIEDVKRAHRETDSQAAIEDVIARAVSEPRKIILGIGEPPRAGIHTLYHGDDLTILNIAWAPLMVLLPHNHNMWASIGIYSGREDNITWERTDAVIEASGAESLSEKEVFWLPDVGIHSVTNPIRRMTGAIHVYNGDFFAPGRSEWDPETLRERAFDLEAARDLFREANERFEANPR
jgi:predicted metal-dependent enzyme (double-stranded beta helix superfamily)